MKGKREVLSMDSEKRHAEIAAGVEAVGLSDDAGQNLKLDQATFFRCVEDGNLPTLRALIKNRSVDTNAYNDEVLQHRVACSGRVETDW